MYGYYTDHLYIASVDGLPEYTGDTVTSAITLYVDILPRLQAGEDVKVFAASLGVWLHRS